MMSDDDIDLDRVVTDPHYRREVIAFLNCTDCREGDATEDAADLQTETFG